MKTHSISVTSTGFSSPSFASGTTTLNVFEGDQLTFTGDGDYTLVVSNDAALQDSGGNPVTQIDVTTAPSTYTVSVTKTSGSTVTLGASQNQSYAVTYSDYSMKLDVNTVDLDTGLHPEGGATVSPSAYLYFNNERTSPSDIYTSPTAMLTNSSAGRVHMSASQKVMTQVLATDSGDYTLRCPQINLLDDTGGGATIKIKVGASAQGTNVEMEPAKQRRSA